MRWTDSMEALADKYIRKALGVADGAPTPLVSVFFHGVSHLIVNRDVSSGSILPFTPATMISKIIVMIFHSKIALLPRRLWHVVFVKYKRS
jgi:hypothetical protein